MPTSAVSARIRAYNALNPHTDSKHGKYTHIIARSEQSKKIMSKHQATTLKCKGVNFALSTTEFTSIFSVVIVLISHEYLSITSLLKIEGNLQCQAIYASGI